MPESKSDVHITQLHFYFEDDFFVATIVYKEVKAVATKSKKFDKHMGIIDVLKQEIDSQIFTSWERGQ
jgi:hypothetical protein